MNAAQTDSVIAPGYQERVLMIARPKGSVLPGLLSGPAGGVRPTGLAVLVIVGGPQYRVGSHRQFVQLARYLAARGHEVLRFDVGGMGDAAGAMRDFEQTGADIRAAVDALAGAVPGDHRVVLWGLCDAASAALLHAAGHARVRGLVLVNPWVRSEQTLAAATVKHYYRQRLFSRELWAKVLRGGFDWRGSLGSLAANLRSAIGRGTTAGHGGAGGSDVGERSADFRERMRHGLAAFKGPVLLLLSTDDLTAREFEAFVAAQPDWSALLAAARVRRVVIDGADHTFSRREGRQQAEQATHEWLTSEACAP